MNPIRPVYNVARNLAKWALRKTMYRDCVYTFRKEEKPFFVRLDINNTCNLSCKQCFYPAYAGQGDPATYMTPDNFRLLASRVFGYAYHIQLGCVFESMLHPQFAEIIREIDAYAPPSAGMVTNGVLLSGAKAEALLDSRNIKSVSVSVDGIEPSTYEAIRGKPLLETVLANIVDFQKAKTKSGRKHPLLRVNTTIMNCNIDELPGIMTWCAENGVDEVQFCHVQPFNTANDESVLRNPDAYNAIHEAIGAAAKGASTRLYLPPPLQAPYFDAERQTYNWDRYEEAQASEYDTLGRADTAEGLPHPYPKNVFCIFPWMGLMIDAWGNLAACCHKTGEPFGNIFWKDLPQAVNSMKILRLRRAMLHGKHARTCPSCRPAFPFGEPTQHRIGRK